MGFWSVLLEITLLLAAAVCLGLLSERLRLSALIGYLLAGVVLGPGGLGLVGSAGVTGAAELGVSLLLFGIGLEFSLARLKRLGGRAAVGGVLQVAVTTAALAAVIGGFGLGWREAVAVGAALALSSTASVIKLLADRTELESLHGRRALAILLVQDAAVVPLVLLITVLAEPTGVGGMLRQLGVALAVGVGLLAAFLLVVRGLLPRLLGASATAGAGNREVPILIALVAVLGAAWSSHALGFSPALGAFVAGVLLAESPFAVQIRADVSGVRVAFVVLFFASVGTMARLEWFVEHGAVLPLLLLSLLLLKSAVATAVLGLLRTPLKAALATALAVCQGGEFAFVLASAALATGVLAPATHQLVVLVTFVSLVLTPFLVRLAGTVAQQPAGAADEQLDVEVPPKDHVVIVGFGPSGREVAEEALRRGRHVVVVDLNPSARRHAGALGVPLLLGDARQPLVLEEAHVQSAAALVVSVPDHAAAEAVVRATRSLAPNLPVIARSRYHRFAPELAAAGADVMDEESMAGRALAARLPAEQGDRG